MECPQCGRRLERNHRFCEACGQQVLGVLRLTRRKKAVIMLLVVAADVVAFLFTSGLFLIVGIPLAFILAIFLSARPRWSVTLPSDKWI